MSGVSSVEQSSTMTSSIFLCVWFRQLSTELFKYLAPLYVGSTTLTFGLLFDIIWIKFFENIFIPRMHGLYGKFGDDRFSGFTRKKFIMIFMGEQIFYFVRKLICNIRIKINQVSVGTILNNFSDRSYISTDHRDPPC